MKKTAAILTALALAACAAKKAPEPNTGLIKAAEPETPAEAGPEDFEKNMPSSSILRRSLIIFENTYSRVYSDDEVVSAAAGDRMAAVLKPGEIGFTMPMCSALVLDGDFTDIWVSGYDALVYGPSRLDYYSAYDCVRYSSLKKALRGPAVLAGGFLMEWEGSRAVMRDARTGGVVFNGDMGSPVASAGRIGERLVFILSDGYIMAYNEGAGAFAIEGTFPFDFARLAYAGGVFYGDLKTGEFFTAGDGESNITPCKGCVLSRSSPYAMCGGVLTGGGEEYAGLPQAAAFSSGAGLYLTVRDGNLNIYSLKNSWQRFISFDYEMPSACLDGSGAVYFKGFSGKAYKIFKASEAAVDEIPEKCSPEGVSLENGRFICGRRECGLFAEKIGSDDAGSMYRRIEDGRRYYYFDGAGEASVPAEAPR